MMGIFGMFGKKEGKKEKEKCPVCGKEMSFFKQTSIENGREFICDDCERKLRGAYDIEGHWVERIDRNQERSQWVNFEDRLRSLSLEEVRQLIRQRDEDSVRAVSELGGQYESIFQVEEVFNISPKATDVGIVRAKAMKNKVVARGSMFKGSLAAKDSAVVKRGPGDVPVNILEVHVCDGTDFDTSLKANMFKKPVTEGANAWLILDISENVSAGDTICK